MRRSLCVLDPQDPFFSKTSPGSVRICPCYKDQSKIGTSITSINLFTKDPSVVIETPLSPGAVGQGGRSQGFYSNWRGIALLSALDQEAPDGP